MILLIKHKVDWGLLFHQKQTQINKYIIREHNKRVEQDYKVRDKVKLVNKASHIYM